MGKDLEQAVGGPSAVLEKDGNSRESYSKDELNGAYDLMNRSYSLAEDWLKNRSDGDTTFTYSFELAGIQGSYTITTGNGSSQHYSMTE
ncbi:MAG: hypothetical protein ACI83O_000649 [Patescibacteria group bacterium]|jgi:hypothetical protein